MPTWMTAMNDRLIFTFCIYRFRNLCTICLKFGHLNNTPNEKMTIYLMLVSKMYSNKKILVTWRAILQTREWLICCKVRKNFYDARKKFYRSHLTRLRSAATELTICNMQEVAILLTRHQQLTRLFQIFPQTCCTQHSKAQTENIHTSTLCLKKICVQCTKDNVEKMEMVRG